MPITKKATVTADGTQPSIAITKLDIMPIVRENQDIVKWRNYTRSAESRVPRRALLYSLYFDVILDAQVISVTGKRRDAITTAGWQYVDKDGQPVPEINELIDSIGFAKLLEEIIDSRFWGYSMVDCNIFKDDENTWQMTATQFDRRHMRPELGMVAFRQYDDEGFSIREGVYTQTVLEAGEEKDLGLLLSAAQYAIYKRGGLGDWATFVEVFGNQILDAQWDGYDEDQRLLLLDAIEKMGNNGRLVRPKGTEVQFVPNQNNATGALQEGFERWLDEQIAKALLGSTETSGTSERTGYAIGKVHADQDEKKNETDTDFVRRILNSRFRKILKAFGLPYEGGKFIIPEKKQKLSLTDEINVYVAMATKLGMPVDHDFIYQRVGMPKPADYDAQMKEKEAQKAFNALNTQIPDDDDDEESADTPPAKKDKKAKKPAGVKLTFRQKLALHMMDFFG
ncbi:phage portal protein family protein [Mucilaginibacter kameinonensis]|uniref:phage portal protein family protein n=1 Tax=Mucilaginibacter kameinonensis TaxID=452286 RepID=UPI000EF7A9FD|nr:DUF935 family protein [Mucilaginibacter kameinonensis]